MPRSTSTSDSVNDLLMLQQDQEKEKQSPPFDLSISTLDVSTLLHSTNSNKQQQLKESQNKKTLWFGFPRSQVHILCLALLIIIIGLTAAVVFIRIGIQNAARDAQHEFDKTVDVMMSNLQTTWRDYTTAAVWIQEACGVGKERLLLLDNFDDIIYQNWSSCSRQDFYELTQAIKSMGMDYEAMVWVANITHAERAAVEQEGKEYFASQGVPYLGHFTTFTPVESNKTNATWTDILRPIPASESAFYFICRYVEPLTTFVSNDVDIWRDPSYQWGITQGIKTGAPFIGRALPLPRDPVIYYFQPEFKSNRTTFQSRMAVHPYARPGLGGLGINVRIYMNLAMDRAYIRDSRIRELSLYMYDIPTDFEREIASIAGKEPLGRYQATIHNSTLFMGGLRSVKRVVDGSSALRSEHEVVTIGNSISMEQALGDDSFKYTVVPYRHPGREWKIIFVDSEGNFEAQTTLFVGLGGAIIFLSCLLVASWMVTSVRRSHQIHVVHSMAKAEKAAIVVANAEKAARAERELNDYIAHEVRNPLAAALAASSFVMNELDLDQVDHNGCKRAREDISVIHSSLTFINDLLRNMLDVHRAANEQLTMDPVPTDVMNDILQPVATLLFTKDTPNVKVEVTCEPEDLVVAIDRIRLKQIILNLANNSRKFVDEGFIRLRALILTNEDGTEWMQLSVEDSGPGIPLTRRKKLFVKFQDSLDSLHQGTGIGLCLCNQLVHLMEGDIYLDEDYHSGIHGCPGSRFVVELPTPPLRDFQQVEDAKAESGKSSHHQLVAEVPETIPLPESLSVLFVDDDLVLRKLFTRAIRKVCPGWSIQEAANGETALEKAKDQTFDLIFLDMYMASIEKQWLGTETVRAMRAHGITSIICGLSANDMEANFLQVGANAFMMKPFPCEAGPLRSELVRILSSQKSD